MKMRQSLRPISTCPMNPSSRSVPRSVSMKLAWMSEELGPTWVCPSMLSNEK